MKNSISSLVDGELEPGHAPAVFAAIKDDGDLRRTWHEYQTIGAALRREGGLGRDMTARVMAALAEEATVLAPRPRHHGVWQQPLVALAASAAGVAVVGWMAFAPDEATGPTRSTTMAQNLPAKADAVSKPVTQRDMQQYLLAHQANAPLSRLHGGTQNIRTVSAAGATDRR